MKEIQISIKGTTSKPSDFDLSDSQLSVVSKNSMFGGGNELLLIGTLSTATIGAITKIVVELIKSKNRVEIEIGDRKIKNISVETAEKIIFEHLNDD